MDEDAFLNRCKQLAGDTSDTRWTDDHLAGFFQNFRPHGKALEPFFQEIPVGTEVYDRLKNVYLATATGYQRGPRTDAYFIVRKPATIGNDTLIQCATQQLANWRAMAEHDNESELVDLLTPLPRIRISTDEPPEVDPNDYSLDIYIYDVQTDWWHGHLSSVCPHARWLREAFYYLNCDYYLARYVMWPWYRDSSSIDDPYKPYFTMWLHGADLHCKSPDDVTLYVKP
ncbi:hypothetical protein [Bremerella cremea]|uniref:hypothetical protein n=1 Tax=Bremerella cremea TaxID=1031537 RepID=UPI0031EDD510